MFNTLCKIRNFDDYVDATAFDDEVNQPFITNLYKNVAS
jgi:oligoendopeptidase F